MAKKIPLVNYVLGPSKGYPYPPLKRALLGGSRGGPQGGVPKTPKKCLFGTFWDLLGGVPPGGSKGPF